MEDYHAMLGHILDSFKQAQKQAIGWDLTYKNTVQRVYFQCPVMFIIGDRDGQDKLEGHFGCQTSKVKMLCRYCNCPTNETDNPNYRGKYFKQNKITELIDKKDSNALCNLAMHCITNAWHDVLFCDPV